MSAGEAVLLLHLTFQSLFDLRHREIFLPVTVMTALAGIFLRAAEGNVLILPLLAAFLPGILFFGFAVATRGSIGIGDALEVLLFGIYLSFGAVLASVFCALLLSSLCSVYLILRKKKGKRTCIPFLPFLLLGYLTLLVGSSL